jgi:hypothetical protein
MPDEWLVPIAKTLDAWSQKASKMKVDSNNRGKDSRIEPNALSSWICRSKSCYWTESPPQEITYVKDVESRGHREDRGQSRKRLAPAGSDPTAVAT